MVKDTVVGARARRHCCEGLERAIHEAVLHEAAAFEERPEGRGEDREEGHEGPAGDG